MSMPTRPPKRLLRPSHLSAAALAAAATVLLGCSQRGADDEPPLASVEGRTITLSELQQGSNLNYLSIGEATERWIDDQVLLNYARDSKLIDRRTLSTRLRNHERQLLAALLLDSLLLRSIYIDPERVREYYANNLKEFQFPAAAALIVHLGFLQSHDARSALQRLRSADHRDSVLNHFNFDRQMVIRHRLIPVLDQAIFSAPVGQLLGPIVSDFGYHLVWVERLFKPGETMPFALVRRDIFERLFQLQRPLARSSILDSLRETLDVQVLHP